jgi:hypothetical protein
MSVLGGVFAEVRRCITKCFRHDFFSFLCQRRFGRQSVPADLSARTRERMTNGGLLIAPPVVTPDAAINSDLRLWPLRMTMLLVRRIRRFDHRRLGLMRTF